jgi:CRISPR system Cascade subunit CasB
MTTPPDVSTATEPADTRSTGSILSAIAGVLGREGFPRGDLAALRRLDPDRANAPDFWRLLASAVPPERIHGPEDERRWALIIHAMALMVPNHHDANARVGRALFEAGYSEQRLGRLLDARGAQFRALVPRLCRQLAHKAQPLDWRELGRLILAADRNEEKAETIRLAIARAYYGAEASAQRTEASA